MFLLSCILHSVFGIYSFQVTWCTNCWSMQLQHLTVTLSPSLFFYCYSYRLQLAFGLDY